MITSPSRRNTQRLYERDVIANPSKRNTQRLYERNMIANWGGLNTQRLVSSQSGVSQSDADVMIQLMRQNVTAYSYHDKSHRNEKSSVKRQPCC